MCVTAFCNCEPRGCYKHSDWRFSLPLSINDNTRPTLFHWPPGTQHEYCRYCTACTITQKCYVFMKRSGATPVIYFSSDEKSDIETDSVTSKCIKIDINVSFLVIFFEIIIKSSIVILEMRPQDIHIKHRTPPRTRAGAKTVCNRRRKYVWKFICYMKTYLQFQEDKYYPGKLWINMQLKFHLWTEIALLQVETANTW